MSNVEVNSNIKWVNREDYCYIYSFYTDRFYKLEDISRDIWILISNGHHNTEKIVRFLTAKYNESQETVNEDVHNFLNQLRDEKLIICS